jgi:hypothetical protein
VVVAGSVTDYTIVSGTIEIGPDCTGSLHTTFTDSNGATGESWEQVIFLRDRQEISAMILGTSPGPVGAMGLGTWKRLPPLPR